MSNSALLYCLRHGTCQWHTLAVGVQLVALVARFVACALARSGVQLVTVHTFEPACAHASICVPLVVPGA